MKIARGTGAGNARATPSNGTNKLEMTVNKSNPTYSQYQNDRLFLSVVSNYMDNATRTRNTQVGKNTLTSFNPPANSGCD